MKRMFAVIAALTLFGSIYAEETGRGAVPPRGRRKFAPEGRRVIPSARMKDMRLNKLNDDEKKQLEKAHYALKEAVENYRKDKSEKNLTAVKAAVDALYDVRIAVTRSSETRELDERLKKMADEKKTATELILRKVTATAND